MSPSPSASHNILRPPRLFTALYYLGLLLGFLPLVAIWRGGGMGFADLLLIPGVAVGLYLVTNRMLLAGVRVGGGDLVVTNAVTRFRVPLADIQEVGTVGDRILLVLHDSRKVPVGVYAGVPIPGGKARAEAGARILRLSLAKQDPTPSLVGFTRSFLPNLWLFPVFLLLLGAIYLLALPGAA